MQRREFLFRAAALPALLQAPNWSAFAPGAGSSQAPRARRTLKGKLLRIHPTNPRYFTDGSDKVVYLTGSHIWFPLQGPGAGPERAGRFLKWLKEQGHNFTRVWSFFYYLKLLDLDKPASPWPYLRTGPGTAADGGLKFDLTRPDEAYFKRLHAFVQEAQQLGIYCSIMLFGSYNMLRDREFRANGAWHPDNNINPQTAVLSQGPDFFKMDAGVLSLQEAHVRRVIDALNGFDNILWEIMNESLDAPGVEAWHEHMIRFIKSCESARAKRHLIGMTGGPDRAGGDKMFRSSADWVSPDNGSSGDFRNGGPGGFTGKLILNDTDHLWGLGGDHRWVWKSFLRGCHPIYMDRAAAVTGDPQGEIPGAEDARKAMAHTLRLSERITLATMSPRNDLASTGYCLANPGKAYVVYLPEGGEVTVDLTAAHGTLVTEWLHPIEGTVTPVGTTDGPGKRRFETSVKGDAVLYIRGR